MSGNPNYVHKSPSSTSDSEKSCVVGSSDEIGKLAKTTIIHSDESDAISVGVEEARGEEGDPIILPANSGSQSKNIFGVAIPHDGNFTLRSHAVGSLDDTVMQDGIGPPEAPNPEQIIQSAEVTKTFSFLITD